MLALAVHTVSVKICKLKLALNDRRFIFKRHRFVLSGSGIKSLYRHLWYHMWLCEQEAKAGAGAGPALWSGGDSLELFSGQEVPSNVSTTLKLCDVGEQLVLEVHFNCP